jgi:hypothetical protein
MIMAKNNSLNNSDIAVVNRIVMTTSGTYIPTTGTKFIDVEAVGGGGSGGGIQATSGSQAAAASSGGGAGYGRILYTAAQLGASAAVTIGVGGAAAAVGSNGFDGTDTNFVPAGSGSTLSCSGGGGGLTQTSSASAQITAGGTFGDAIGGQLHIAGGSCPNSLTLAAGVMAMSGPGGSTPLGEGGISVNVISPSSVEGQPGSGFGAGSSGAAGCNTATPQTSAAGQPGVVIITEYI